MAFLNNVHIMNGGVDLALPATGSIATVDAYKGEPGNPTGGVVMDKCVGLGVSVVTRSGSTAVGVAKIQYSEDNINWNDSPTQVPSAGAAIVSGAASYRIHDPSPFGKWMRVNYTATSGTGNAQVRDYVLTRRGL